MTLILENIPPALSAALRTRAQAEGKTVEQFALEVLEARISDAQAPVKRRDLSDIAGTWVEDPLFEEIRKEHDQIDPDLWK